MIGYCATANSGIRSPIRQIKAQPQAKIGLSMKKLGIFYHRCVAAVCCIRDHVRSVRLRRSDLHGLTLSPGRISGSC